MRAIRCLRSYFMDWIKQFLWNLILWTRLIDGHDGLINFWRNQKETRQRHIVVLLHIKLETIPSQIAYIEICHYMGCW